MCRAIPSHGSPLTLGISQTILKPMDSEQKEIEYVKLWMEQSKLYWSRFQTIAAIQTGIYLSWWTVFSSSQINNRGFCFPISILGILLTAFVIAIMDRDAAYMDTMKDRAGDRFPETLKEAGTGRFCAKFLAWILIASNVILYILAALIP